jgi:hypothetical protein
MRERDRERERERERGKKRDKKEDIGPPGAGTLWVYDLDGEEQRSSRRPLSRGKAASKERDREREKSRREISKDWGSYDKVSVAKCGALQARTTRRERRSLGRAGVRCSGVMR